VLIALGALLCAWAGWALAEVPLSVASESRIRIVLADVSDSVTRVRPQFDATLSQALSAEARAAEERDERLAVIGFAREVVRWYGPASPTEFRVAPEWYAGAPLRRDGTALASALAAAERMAQVEGAMATVRVLGDGTYTGADPSALSARVTTEWVTLPDASVLDPGLGHVELPREVEVGAPLTARVELSSLPTSARSGARIAVRGLPTGEQVFAVPEAGPKVRLELGAMPEDVLELTFELRVPQDPIPENNVASATVRTRSALAVVLLASESERASAEALARAWSAEPGVEARVEPWREGAALPQQADLLVTLDLDPRSLSADVVGPLVEQGGGWIAAGGAALLAGLDTRATGSCAELLPLEPEDDDAPRDVVLAVDASGSMDGAAFDSVRNAALELVGKLRSADRMSLALFTDRLGPAQDLGAGASDAARQRELAREMLDLARPSGPTDLPQVFEQLVELRERVRRPALLLVLTDGRDQRSLPSARGRLGVAVERLAEAGVRTVVLASGAEPDREFLSVFERPDVGCTLRAVEGDLEGALERSANEGRWRAGARSVVPQLGAGDSFAEELARALQSSPGIERTLALRARAGDRVVLSDSEGHPLLAVRPHGLGWCATFGTLPSGKGSPAWARGSAWVPLVRGLARGRRSAATEPPSVGWAPSGELILGPFEPREGRSVSALGIGQRDGGPVELELRCVASAAFERGTYLALDPTRVETEDLATLRLESNGRSLGRWAIPPRVEAEYRQPPKKVVRAASARAVGAGLQPRHPRLGWAALVLGGALVASGTLLSALKRGSSGAAASAHQAPGSRGR
jgi:hypothetical protein